VYPDCVKIEYIPPPCPPGFTGQYPNCERPTTTTPRPVCPQGIKIDIKNIVVFKKVMVIYFLVCEFRNDRRLSKLSTSDTSSTVSTRLHRKISELLATNYNGTAVLSKWYVYIRTFCLIIKFFSFIFLYISSISHRLS
jgi:hypothetical protein